MLSSYETTYERGYSAVREVAFLARLYFQAATSNLLKGKSSLPSRSASLTLSPPRHSRREADRSRKDTADGLQHDEKDEKQLRNDEKQPRNNEARESTGEKWSLYNAEKDRERVDERGSEFLSADETPRRAGSMSGTNEKYFLVRSKKSRRIVASGKPPQWEFGIAAKVLTGECEVISVSINAGRMDAIALSAAAVIGAGSPAKRRPSLVGLHERERRVGVEEGDDEAEKAELRRPIPVTFGEHSSQGSRPSMEDAHAVFLNTFEGEMTRTSCSFFGVYDGHGGREAAVYLRDYLHLQIRNSQHFRRDIKAALQEAFLWTDRALLDNARRERYESGAVAVTVIIRHRTAFISNVGDSRAVLSRGRRSLELSNDHTLELQRERDRIVNSGGKVIGGRLNGILAVSRAFGDLHHIRPDKDKDKDSSGEGTSQSWEKARKMLGLSVEPRIVEEELHKDDRFVIIACDGLWDVLSNQGAVDFVEGSIELRIRSFVRKAPEEGARRTGQTRTLDREKLFSAIAKDLVGRALELGSDDNVSVIVVGLNNYPPLPPEEERRPKLRLLKRSKP